MIQSFHKIRQVKGTLSFRGDKSISHRALLISSLADGKSSIKNLSDSEDVKSTINCLRTLGIEIESNGDEYIITGRGFKGYKKPLIQLNTGNSGTTARLLSGILSVQNFESTIVGDESLSLRPMQRVIEPLSKMGAKILNYNGCLPMNILPIQTLNPIDYRMPVPSAQVKSAILLAGLHSDKETSVSESFRTRNHTENLLGLRINIDKDRIISTVSRINFPVPIDYYIPGDISSAMYFIVLALLTKNSELLIENVSLNSTRIESLNLFKRMGGDIQIKVKGSSNHEKYGDILVHSSELKNVVIEKNIIPLIIDEIPILAIAGIYADGAFEIRGATELRVKESDRIQAICKNLLKSGCYFEEYDDGFNVSGTISKVTGPFNSFGDHRIAMAFAILSSLMENGGAVENFKMAAISNPNFIEQLISVAN